MENGVKRKEKVIRRDRLEMACMSARIMLVKKAVIPANYKKTKNGE